MKLDQFNIFSRVTFLDTLFFTKHLSILIKSGITILESLLILNEQTKSGAFKKVIDGVADSIKNGNTLAHSLKKYPDVFNAFYVALIEVGEQSGTLEENLHYLADQLSKEHTFRQKVRGALMYPTIILIAAVSIGFGMSYFVLPKLLDLFTGLNVPLSLNTRILLWFAGVMQNYGILVIICVAGIFTGLYFLSKTKAVKPFFESLFFKIPFIGDIAEKSELTALCRSLGIMLQSGLPVTSALEIERSITTNSIFQEYILGLISSVTRGKTLSEELSKPLYKKIPLIAKKMIGVGEETGKLDETLLYLGDFFEDSVDDATKNFITVLEPVLLIVIGAVVAFVAFSIISPIYSLTGSLNR